MTSLTSVLLEMLSAYGPGFLFVMAVGETSFVTGLVVTSGVATSVAAVLATQGVMPYEAVALAAVSGGWTGDTIGYWIGRRWGDRLLPRRGHFGASVRRAYEKAAPFFGRHPVYSVTVARLVPFVRTVMPLGAGGSGLSYGRFLRYEIFGVLGWAAMYMAAGVLAGESWELATSTLGVGWTVVFVVSGGVLWLMQRRHAAVRRAPGGDRPGGERR